MVSFKSLFLLALSATSTLAAPVSESPAAVVSRQSSGGTCGSNDYTAREISSARGEGCNLYQNGDTVGSNDYPHTFNNREGFDFLVGGPYQEFPVLASGRVFDGSTSPGPDRVIFNTGCQYAGLITHTGASGNNFVSCDY